MISFIVIGRNEGWKLTKCFKSVFKTIKYNNLKDFEVIYVDSKSTDDSIARAKKFPEVKVFQITGQCNAAIGRNIGAKEAKGDILIFLDGDLEMYPEFFRNAFNNKEHLIHPCLSGQSINYSYNSKNILVKKSNDHKFKKDYYAPLTCGYFIIERESWEKVNGMRNFFVFGEDPDLGLRLAKKNILMLRLKDLFVNHHTVSRKDGIRMWKLFIKGSNLYTTTLMIRHNFFNRYLWRYIIRQDYSMIALIVFLILSFLFHTPMILLLYLIIVLFRTKLKKGILHVINRFIFFIMRDIVNIFGFFLFFPSKNKYNNYSYIRVE